MYLRRNDTAILSCLAKVKVGVLKGRRVIALTDLKGIFPCRGDTDLKPV